MGLLAVVPGLDSITCHIHLSIGFCLPADLVYQVQKKLRRLYRFEMHLFHTVEIKKNN